MLCLLLNNTNTVNASYISWGFHTCTAIVCQNGTPPPHRTRCIIGFMVTPNQRIYDDTSPMTTSIYIYANYMCSTKYKLYIIDIIYE